MKHSFCEDWEFTRHWTEAFGKGLPVPKQQAVRLPHTCREVPLHYATPADYEMVCGYRKRFRVPPVQAAPRLFLRFDGAAHQAVVRVNGRVAGQHRGGYTGFAVEITEDVYKRQSRYRLPLPGRPLLLQKNDRTPGSPGRS